MRFRELHIIEFYEVNKYARDRGQVGLELRKTCANEVVYPGSINFGPSCYLATLIGIAHQIDFLIVVCPMMFEVE